MKHLFPIVCGLLLLVSCQDTEFQATEEVFALRSLHTGRDYEMTVLLPPGYSTTQTYPTVYLLDGYWHYPGVAAFARRQMEKSNLEPLILVGVGYAGIKANTLSGVDSIFRVRVFDLTYPTEDDSSSIPGTAFDFRRFLKDELIPEVENRYATSAADRTLMGHSLGGYFAIWEMLTFAEQPLFRNFAAGSPALFWAEGFLLDREAEVFNAGTPLPFRLHTTMGSLESVMWNTWFDEFEARLQSRNRTDLDVTFVRLPQGHTATAETSFEDGLQHFFGR
ncbi:MAG: alpha/beta hydrolase-fold protein [Bacteroidota bacterium]